MITTYQDLQTLKTATVGIPEAERAFDDLLVAYLAWVNAKEAGLPLEKFEATLEASRRRIDVILLENI